MSYTPPLREQRFALDAVAAIGDLAALPGFSAATDDLIDAVLSESARLVAGVMAPLNRVGDIEGARFDAGAVRLPDGFAEAYRAYVDGGWATLAAPVAFGGQGLPFVLSCAVLEQLISANMALSLCPLLTQGAVTALVAHASDDIKQSYLPKLVSGEWTGTMNLTEPQAGSDVGALKTRAMRAEDGTYRIKGSKIFITWGEHDLTDNIVHLVLARLDGAPAGTKGISLFVVPKLLPDGRRNDVACISIERKLGIHASPTCTMSYGDHDACVGYLVGEENTGMRAMFTMMNHARLNVGLQGVAMAERACQAALAHARERVQSARIGGDGRPVRIIEHADIRRMLMTMKALTEAARSLAYANAAAMDRAHAEASAEARAAAQGLADLLTPITKAWCTEIGVEVASLAIQIHGGMGFIEETGVAQYLRDARIAPIYEGTNGIQALDLVGRKLHQNGGAHWRALAADLRGIADGLAGHADLSVLAPVLTAGLDALERSSAWLFAHPGEDAAAGASPYLRLFGTTLGAALLAKQALAAATRIERGDGDSAFPETKFATASFFIQQILPQALGLEAAIRAGAEPLYRLSERQFEAG